ncbi:peptide ABC transporter permease [Streptacidiphilus pinicola]|uniref:Oligopeptide transport system permease protein OppC n=1 Tax=Streptacidiphilus pinicola TaxID=2219663 RepID=A0A2X0KCA8_9ACTN|nr:ABC transporter permease [Streptacidiphilus pinicola]RAG84640.1 peptide ABC transporter permease [Streptacidiphilus pinicola]
MTQLVPDVPADVLPEEKQKKTRTLSRGALVRRRFRRNRLAMVGVGILAVLLVGAYVLPYFLKFSYTDNDWNALGTAPDATHWFGTNHPGVDMLALTMRGLQKSLVIGLIGGPLTTLIAALVGASAGYFGGWIDRILMWVLELMLVVPSFLLLALIAPRLAGGTWLYFVVLLSAFGWMITARVVRSMTQTLKDREYVLAARYMGVNPLVIIFRHILPNVASILIVDATIQVGAVVLSESGLSYFGFGIQAPDISLGTLIADGQPDATTSPWMFFFPAGFLVLMGLCVAFIGDGLRDAFDPTAAGAKAVVKSIKRAKGPIAGSPAQDVVSNTARAEEGLAS